MILSTTIEYLAIEVITVYFSLVYITRVGSLFVGFLMTALSLLGPVVLGPIAGALIDRAPVSLMWLPSALLAPILIMAATATGPLSPVLPALLVAIISLLGYASTCTRITSSKHVLAAGEMAGYHSNLATILHLIPIAAPFIAGLLLSSGASRTAFGIVLLIALPLAALSYRSAVSGHHTARAHGSAVGVGYVATRIRDAWAYIRETPILLQSVIVASVINFVGFTNEYLAVSHLVKVDFRFDVWPSLPLMLSGLGAILSALFARHLKKVHYGTTLWCCQALTIVATLCCYSSSNPIVFCVTLLLNGAVGATAAATAWSVRLHATTPANIGVIAGVTSALYKVHSLLFLPLVGKLAGANGALFGALFASTIAVATLAVLFAYARRQALRQRAG